MKLYFSPASPFVRKCLVVARELGLADQIEKLPSAAHPINHDRIIGQTNPLAQVPTFLTPEGQGIYDSRVICEYLNERAQGSIFPPASEQRWLALTEQSLADGMLDAALLARYEKAVRPEEFQWKDWAESQMRKIVDALDHFERVAQNMQGRVDIGTITLACALGYLDFRFPDFDWRSARPALTEWFTQFSERPSMVESAPHA